MNLPHDIADTGQTPPVLAPFASVHLSPVFRAVPIVPASPAFALVQPASAVVGAPAAVPVSVLHSVVSGHADAFAGP